MKHNILPFLSAISALVLLASCAEKVNTAYEGPVALTVSLSCPTHTADINTKVSGDQSVNDVTIKDMQVFVFDQASGQIDNCARQMFSPAKTSSATLSEAMNCTSGVKEVWALVNWPVDLTTSGAAVLSVTDLKSRTANLSDNAADALIMTGSVSSQDFNAPVKAVSVPVSRLCAAVVLKSVVNQMLVPSYQDKVSISGAFLMNVPAVQRVDGSIEASSSASPTDHWMGFYARPTSALLNESFSATPIAYGTSPATQHTFYTFSNNFSGVLGNGSEKSSTYLKVEIVVNGQTKYYPVLLPALERNKKYEVTLTINHISNITDPASWALVSGTSLNATVSVSDWTTIQVPETI